MVLEDRGAHTRRPRQVDLHQIDALARILQPPRRAAGANDGKDLVAGGAQVAGEVGADETASAGDERLKPARGP